MIAIVLVAAVFLTAVMICGLVSMVGGASGGISAAAQACGPDTQTVGVTSTVTVADIPQVAFDAYQKAAAASGIDWSYIAGIGKVESDHGRFGGVFSG